MGNSVRIGFMRFHFDSLFILHDLCSKYKVRELSCLERILADTF